MAIDVQFLYKNLVAPNKTYESVDEFFDSAYTGTTDEEDLKVQKAHEELNKTYIYERMSILTPDKKGVVTVRRFDTSSHYNEWKKQRSVLPNIDFNISEQEGFFINIKQWGNIDLERQIEEFN